MSAVDVGCLQREKARETALALEDNEEEEEGEVAPPAEPLPLGNPCGCAANARDVYLLSTSSLRAAFYNRSPTFILES